MISFKEQAYKEYKKRMANKKLKNRKANKLARKMRKQNKGV